MHIGIGLAIGLGSRMPFDFGDLTNGTLILDFVNPPPMTLSLDFTTGTYSQWTSDPSTADLVGYYQVKG